MDLLVSGGEGLGRFAGSEGVVSVSSCLGISGSSLLSRVHGPSGFLGSGVMYSLVSFVALKWGGFVDDFQNGREKITVEWTSTEYDYHHGNICGVSGFRTMPAGQNLAEIPSSWPQRSHFILDVLACAKREEPGGSGGVVEKNHHSVLISQLLSVWPLLAPEATVSYKVKSQKVCDFPTGP